MRMQAFKNLPIPQKIILLMCFSSVLALLITTICFTFFLTVNMTRSSLQDLSILAKTIGKNSVSSLLFHDVESGEKTLAALNAAPDIEEAYLVTADGQPFAHYRKTGRSQGTDVYSDSHFHASNPSQLSRKEYFEDFLIFNRCLEVTVPLHFDDALVGSLWVKKNKSRLNKSIATYTAITVSALICVLCLSYILAVRFHSVISQPIIRLAKSMDKVSRKKDYKIRVECDSTDEIGTLMKGFNTMLEEIQLRDDKLLFTQYSIDHAGDAAYWTDNKGRFYYANKAALKLLGMSEEELFATTINDIDPDFFSAKWSDFWEKLQEQGTLTRMTSLKRKNGDMVPVEITASYVHYDGQEYNCAMVRDISERKRMEEQIHQAEKMQVVGTLAAGVAHDLNNILSGVVGYPELLLLDLPTDDPMYAPLEMIRNSGQRAAAIILDLVSLTRRGAVILKTVNLNTIIDDYLQSAEFLTLKKKYPNVMLRTNLDPDLHCIMGSSVHLSKTVMNLLINGLEAVLESGQVAISTYNRHLDRPVNGYDDLREREYAVLSIEDNGAGIAESDHKRIFEPFYTKKELGRSGTGLGMTVVWATVKDHEGYIDLSTAVGKGTRFDLYFPVTREKTDKEPATMTPEHLTGQGTVLVVDDVFEQRDIAATMLHRLGYKVDTMESGEAAVEFLRDNHVDIIVLDMIMDPGMSGLETYKRILEIHPGQKAIIASGFSESEDAKKVQQLGAGAFIMKPYTLEQLGSAVQGELNSGV